MGKEEIEQYLSEVKDAVLKDRYRIERNTRRQDNINLFFDYVVDEAKAKEILLSLTAMDFCDCNFFSRTKISSYLLFQLIWR